MEPNINKQVYKTGILIVALVIISISCEKDELFRIPEVDGFTSALQSFDRDQNIIRPLDFYLEALKYDFSVQLGMDVYQQGYEEFLLCYMMKQFVTKIGMLVLIFLILLGCKSNPSVESQPAIFIDNRNSSFYVVANSNDTLDCLIYVIRKPVLRYTEDSILLSTNYKYYFLEHYLKYNDYHDDTFIKPSSILDSITYKNKTWLEVE